MKAYTRYIYGGPEVLQLEETAKPTLKDDHILVKILANSVNPADWHILRGDPFFSRLTYGLLKPKDKVIGSDFAGIVEDQLLYSSPATVYLVQHLREEHLQNTSVCLRTPVDQCRQTRTLLKWLLYHWRE